MTWQSRSAPLDGRSARASRLGIILVLAALGSEAHSEENNLSSVWPTQRGAYVTTSSESIPVFPQKLSGYISMVSAYGH
jgi:hypothetical protein